MDPLAGLTRLSVRRRLADGGHGDVVGHLVAQDEGSLTLLPEDRGPVTIRRADVVASRAVPPRAVRPSSAPADLARFLARHWPGTEQERLGGWLLRSGGGFTRRANSALAVGDPGMPVQAALRHVVEWYAARGVPARLQVIVGDTFAPTGWAVDGGDLVVDGSAVGDTAGVGTVGDDAAGVAAVSMDAVGTNAAGKRAVGGGTTAGDETAVLVGDLRRDIAPAGVGADVEVTVTDAPSAEWFELWRGGGSDGRVETAVLTAAPARYVLLAEGGTPVACGRVAVERRWAHVSCVDVAPGERGRGLGRAVMAACLSAAPEADFLALEVEQANAAAMHLYTAMGLRERYRYRYVEAAAADGTGEADAPGQAGGAPEADGPRSGVPLPPSRPGDDGTMPR